MFTNFLLVQVRDTELTTRKHFLPLSQCPWTLGVPFKNELFNNELFNLQSFYFQNPNDKFSPGFPIGVGNDKRGRHSHKEPVLVKTGDGNSLSRHSREGGNPGEISSHCELNTKQKQF